jgi:membrane-associated phospholipid phosphatase
MTMISIHPSRRANLLVAAGAVLVTLGLLTELAESVKENDTMVGIDQHILSFIVTHRRGWLSRAAHVITMLGGTAVVSTIVVIGAVALLSQHRRRHAALLIVSTGGTAVLVSLAKQIVGRPRPSPADQIAHASGAAFPSGHAAQGVACYLAAAFLLTTIVTGHRMRIAIWSVAALIAATIGASRVYLGVHWPSDVISGWLLSGGWLTMLLGIWYTIPPRRNPQILR